MNCETRVKDRWNVEASKNTYARACCGSRTRHLAGLTTHSQLGLGVARSLHVRELVGTFLAEIVEATRKHDLGLAGEESVARNLDGLESGRTVYTVRRKSLTAANKTYQAPTGILIGPLEESRRRLIHPAVVLMNLE